MKWKLSAFIGIALLVTLGASELVLFRSSKAMLIEQAQNNVRALFRERTARIDDFEQRSRLAFDAIAASLTERLGDAKTAKDIPLSEFRDLVGSLLRGKSDILNVTVVDKRGYVVLSTVPELTGADYSHRSEVKNARLEPHLGVPDGNTSKMTALYAGILQAKGSNETPGILIIQIDMRPILDVLDSSSLGRTGEIALATSAGDEALFAVAPHLMAGSERRLPLAQVPIMQRAISGESGDTRGIDYQGHEVLASFAPAAIKGWGFVAKIDVDEVYAPVQALAIRTLGTGIVIACLAMLVAYWMSARIVRPIAALASSAKRVESGDFSARVSNDTEDELGRLSRAFNAMVKSLGEYRDRMEALVENRTQEALRGAQRFKTIFDHSNDAIIVIDVAKDRIIDANPRAVEMLGYEREQLVATPVSAIHPDELPQLREFAAMVYKDSAGWTSELSCCTRSGKRLPSEISASVMQLPEHSGEVILAMVRDISERKKMEIQLRLQAEELKRLNAELERFANVAAHDLKSPIGTIHGFLELLLQTHGDRLDGEATEYVEAMIRASTKMAKLVDSLLSYARSGHQDSPNEQVDLNSVIQRAIWNLNSAIKERNAIVHVDGKESKIVVGDEEQLVQLFQNLIGNAIKYCDADQPVVSVRGVETGHVWQVCVQDNGIGFDMAEAEAIFRPFHRLCTEKEYSGTGLGLSVCKRIVERHGGSIRAESTKGVGTCFYITFPKDTRAVAAPRLRTGKLLGSAAEPTAVQ